MKQMKFNTLPSLLDEFFYDCCLPTNNDYVPIGDVIETDDAFNIELMMPGFKKKEIKMEVKDKTLSISAERIKNEKSKYNTVESYFGKYSKYYTLPDYVNENKIDATYENGVLKITIPKKEKVGNKFIEIK